MNRKSLGDIKRGVVGLLNDNLYRVPRIPSNIHDFSIGNSVLGKSIACFKLGRGLNKVLFVFGIHGNETGAVKLAHYFLNWINKNDEYFKNISLFVIPCLNPDGYNLAQESPNYFHGGKIGRFNANNVDLNRNFDTPIFCKESIWSSGKNYKEKNKVYCGEFGNSEPETKAITKFIKDNQIKIMLSFHNAGADVMSSEDKVSKKLAMIYSQKTGFHNMEDFEWEKMQQGGTAKEWCELNHISFIEIEGTTRWNSDWKKQKKAIIEVLLFIGNVNYEKNK